MGKYVFSGKDLNHRKAGGISYFYLWDGGTGTLKFPREVSERANYYRWHSIIITHALHMYAML